MIDLLLLAVGLSMDAFAVSVGLGAKHRHKPAALAVMAGLWFGVFQGVMPLIGYAGGRGLLGWLHDWTPWISFALLALIGAKMIREALSPGDDELPGELPAKLPGVITWRVMLVLAVATSIDALAAGFALNAMRVEPLLACALIALVTAALSALGVYVGVNTGTRFESKAELLGGVVLIGIGAKIALL